MAHGLGIDVVAEGIETAEQLAWLRQLACDRGQGFFYARPLPADELEALLVAASTEPVILPVSLEPSQEWPRAPARWAA